VTTTSPVESLRARERDDADEGSESSGPPSEAAELDSVEEAVARTSLLNAGTAKIGVEQRTGFTPDE
jgi:hypothetical protein